MQDQSYQSYSLSRKGSTNFENQHDVDADRTWKTDHRASCIEALIVAGQQQQLRQVKRMQQIKRSAEIQLQRQQQLEDKLRTQDSKMQNWHQEQKNKAQQNAQKRRHAEQLYSDILLQAQNHLEQKRQYYEEKQRGQEARKELFDQQKQQQIKQNRLKQQEMDKVRKERLQKSQEIEQMQRELYRAKHDNADTNYKRQQEARQAQIEQQKQYDQTRRDLIRQQVAQRAEAELENRIKLFRKKQQEKDENIRKQNEMQEKLRKAKVEETTTRQMLRQLAVANASEEDKKYRNLIMQKYQNKLSRTNALELEKDELLRELEQIRREMNFQQYVLKAGYDKIVKQNRPAPEVEQIERSGFFQSMQQMTLLSTHSSLPKRPGTAGCSPRQPMDNQYYMMSQSLRDNINQSPNNEGRQSLNIEPIDDPNGQMVPPVASPDRQPKKQEEQSQGEDTESQTSSSQSERAQQLKAYLEQEQQQEELREEQLKLVSDPEVREQLIEQYNLEREEARGKIMELTGSL